MGYKINFEGLEVVCETPQDVVDLARLSTRRRATVTEEREPASQNGHRKTKSLKELMRKGLSENTKNFLKVLVASNGRADAVELVRSLHLSSTSSLGGTIATLAKESRRAGIDHATFLTKDVIGRNKQRKVTYSLNSDALNEIREGLRM